MLVGFATTLRSLRATDIITALGTGSANASGRIEFYTSPRPATGVAISTQTLVGTCTLSEPAGTVTDGVLTFDTISDDVSADADADILWARFLDRDLGFVMDVGCGTTGSGEAIIFNTLTARIGGVIQILSGSLTEGNL